MTDDNEKKIYHGRIKVPYKHTAGAYVEKFITEIGKNNKIMISFFKIKRRQNDAFLF